ncbi:MAG: lamin tail domain-containing protein, partial [Chloroflexota bacterium]
TVSDVIANQIYTGALGDTNDSLTLSMPSGTVVDTANSNLGAWSAGTGSPNFYSMERVVTSGVPAADTDAGWVSNITQSTWTKHDARGTSSTNFLIHGTPGYGNWGFIVTATSSPTTTFTPTRTPTRTPTSTPTRTSTPGICGAGFSPTSIIISEVAWGGTAASTSDEWIELYNPTSNSFNLNNWVLRAVDGKPNITLVSATILAPGQFYLLERADDTTVSDVTANQIYNASWDLGNIFETLQLYNSSGVCVDTANSNSGSWPAGTASSTYYSMERVIKNNVPAPDSDTGWITNNYAASWLKHDANGSGNNNLIHGTPGYGNWASTVTPTALPPAAKTSTPFKFHTSTPAPLPPPALVGINEFVPRPGHDWNNDGVVDTGDEYIELINFGGIDVNLSGYRLDDQANGGSDPYSLPSVTLKPGQRMVFYGKDTRLVLSDGGDAVRLQKPNGQLADAYDYFVVKYPDQSYCRLPDNGGLDDWNTNCFPTPGLQNALSGNFARPPTEISDDKPLCPISDVLPLDFVWAECPSFGNIWSRFYWDVKGWFGEKSIPNNNSKWEVYVD